MEKYLDRTLAPCERAKDLLTRLSLREKVGQINQRLYGFRICRCTPQGLELAQELKEEVERFGGLGVLYGLYRADPWSGRNYENGLVGEKAVDAYNLVQEYVISHSRFGIPMLLSSESPHGHQALDGYLLPVNLAAGAAWNTGLLERACRVCGAQLKQMGVDLALVSMLDVLRDPRWGRSEECFGEDPYHASAMAKAAVRGYLSEGVDVVAKHFAAQGETTGGVNASAARIGERELREIHLPPAQAAVDAGARGFMAAYNEIDGIPCHNNPYLLGDILRGEMGFEGLIMADGVAVDRLSVLCGSEAACGAAALGSGVDVSLWDEGFAHLEEAVERGLVSMERLDEAVLRVLTLKFERGLFEKPYLEYETGGFQTDTASLELARESVVLLKNENHLLPLGRKNADVRKIAVIGENLDDIYSILGDYTPPVRTDNTWTLERGIRYAAERNPQIEITVCKERTEAVRLALECDVTVLVLGGSSSRFGEVSFDTNGAAVAGSGISMDCGEGVDISELQLPQSQRLLMEEVFKVSEKTVTVVVAGRPYDISAAAERTDALLYSFYPGPWGGLALAEILFGEQEPSGRLPVSLPRSCGQLPVWYNHRTSYEAMHYSDVPDGALYPFGYGLGYGEPQYKDFRVSSDTFVIEKEKQGQNVPEEGIVISFCAENHTDHPVSAVPMLFVSHLGGSVVPRVRELKGFAKEFLQPGEQRQMQFAVTSAELAVWNCRMKRQVERGKVRLEIRDGARMLWQTEISVR